jgi:VIT1/CCC1 family predicted Fe2+/Mn2+ transporter
VTTFAIVASVVGASFPIEVVLLTGFAKLIGDALSMGLGDCISEQAEQAHIRGERKRELWEFQNYADGERKEMVDIYVSKGLSVEDATRIIDIISKPAYEGFFVDHMVTHELGLVVPDEGDNPVKDGAVCFLSFMFWGSIPLWLYVIFYGAEYHDVNGSFGICIAVTLLCLFGLGAMQAQILQQSRVKQGFLMMLNGGLAAAAAYLVGWGLQQSVSGGSNCIE